MNWMMFGLVIGLAAVAFAVIYAWARLMVWVVDKWGEGFLLAAIFGGAVLIFAVIAGLVVPA